MPSWVDERVIEAHDRLAEGDDAPIELLASPGTQVTIAHFGRTVFTPPITV